MNVASFGANGADGSDDLGPLRFQGDGAPCAELRRLGEPGCKRAHVLRCELLVIAGVSNKEIESLLLPILDSAIGTIGG